MGDMILGGHSGAAKAEQKAKEYTDKLSEKLNYFACDGPAGEVQYNVAKTKTLLSCGAVDKSFANGIAVGVYTVCNFTFNTEYSRYLKLRLDGGGSMGGSVAARLLLIDRKTNVEYLLKSVTDSYLIYAVLGEYFIDLNDKYIENETRNYEVKLEVTKSTYALQMGLNASSSKITPDKRSTIY